MRERLAANVPLQEGPRRHVIRDALGQMGHDRVAAEERLLPAGAQVSSQIASDRGEDRLGRLVRVHEGGRGLGRRALQVGGLRATHVPEGLLGDADELGLAPPQTPLELVLLVQAIVGRGQVRVGQAARGRLATAGGD